MNHEDDPDDDPDDQLYTTGTGYDDGVEGMPSPSEHRAPQTWADVEAHALVSADRVLAEHVDGEEARAEREREGADPPPRRRGIFQ